MPLKKVIILGAGISGLALGWFLKQRHGDDLELHIIEKSHRSGGWIQTHREQGFLFEQGPHSCRTRGAGVETLQLLESLGLQDEVISADASAKKRFLYRQGKLQALPSNSLSLLFSPWFFKIAKAFWNDWHAPRGQQEDESIHVFVSRRLGSDIAEQLFDPLTKGIYAGNPRDLSMHACFPMMASWERKHGGLIRGLLKQRTPAVKGSSPFVQSCLTKPIFSLKQGMQTLPDKLAETLHTYIHYGVSASEIHSTQIKLSDGSQLAAEHVYAAIPAHEVAPLLPHIPSLYNLGRASLAVVNLGYHQAVLKKKGFGYLIPTMEQEDLLGVIWDSSVFPQQNRTPQETRLTAMVPLRSGLDPVKTALDALSRHLGIDSEPDAIQVSLAHQAIPQYGVGHFDLLKEIEGKLPQNVTLLGSSYRGVSVNECVLEAKELSLR